MDACGAYVPACAVSYSATRCSFSRSREYAEFPNFAVCDLQISRAHAGSSPQTLTDSLPLHCHRVWHMAERAVWNPAAGCGTYGRFCVACETGACMQIVNHVFE